MAGAGSRLAAFIIDYILQTLAILLTGGILLAINHQLNWAIRGSTLLGVFIILAFIINFGYFIAFELGMNGQTPGKRLFGLRAIRDNGQPIEFTQSLVRGIIRSSLDMLYVGLFAILFSQKHKRIGDMAAGTIVVCETYDNKHEPTLQLHPQPIPPFLPPLPEMTQPEREVVESWLRRKDSLPYGGRDIAKKLSDYFAEKEKNKEQPPSV